jgi:hypothetical protein
MQAGEFVHFCEDELLRSLRDGERPPHHKVAWATLQLHYGDQRVHFELQPRSAHRSLEIGLHFEGAVEVNDAWASLIAARAPEILGELGADWELEVWTASWRRLHRVYAIEALNPAFGREVSAELSRAVRLLGPVVAAGLAHAPGVGIRRHALA